jgi:hypothetical protein
MLYLIGARVDMPITKQELVRELSKSTIQGLLGFDV